MIWKSSDTAVARVDSNGKVVGLKAGTVDITVTTKDGKKSDICKVEVNDPDKGIYPLNFSISSLFKNQGEIDSYKFNVTERGLVTIYTEAGYTDYDPSNGFTQTFGNLSSENGEIIAEGNNYGENNFIISQVLDPGIYSINVKNRFPDRFGDYQLNVYINTNLDKDDYSDNPAEAHEIFINSLTPGYLSAGGDIDYFKFTLAKESLISIHTEGTTDTFGVLMDAEHNIITTGHKYYALHLEPNFLISETNLQPGTYYLSVKDSNANQTGAYVLEFNYY